MTVPARYSILCALGCAGLALGLTGCAKNDPAPAVVEETESPPALARVNGRVLTKEDFQYEVQRRVAARKPLADSKTILQEMIDREVMLQSARKSDLMKDPDVRRELENQMLVHWLSRTMDIEKDAVTVSDEEVRQVYEKNIAEYTKPALVRLAILYRKISPMEPDEVRAALRAELEKGCAAFLQDPQAVRQGGRMSGFGSIAADYSEEATSRYRGGDLGWLDPSRPSDRFPDEVMTAGLALPVDTFSEVLTTDQGLFVVMKTGTRPPRITPFDDVAASLRRRLIRERQESIQQTFLAELIGESHVEIDSDQVALLNTHDSISATAVGEQSSPDSRSNSPVPFRNLPIE